MRIAFFSETFIPKVDGIVTRLRNTISQLRKAGDEVIIFAPDGGIDDFEGAKVVGLPSAPFPLYPELRLALPRSSMRKALAEFQPDIIHAVDPVLLGIAGIYYASMLHIPLVASYHTQLPKYLAYYRLGMIEPLVWKLLRVRHNRAALNLCTSQAMVDELTSHGISRVILWQRGIDTDLFHPDKASSEMRAYLTEGNPDAPLLLYVGRLSPEKNIEQLKQILCAVPGARLALVGGGPHRAILEKHFEGTPTLFAGYLEGQRLAAAFASSDVFVLPSRTETLGLVLLEAMAAGCPVVAARAGGIPDIVQDGVNGLLFNEEHEAIQAVQLLIQNAETRDRIRTNALQEAQTWGWAAATAQLRRFYAQVLASAESAVTRERALAAARERAFASNPPMKRMAKLAAIGVIRRVLR
jgi:glycosyltransferase involved in cell wall biosynthesis